MIHIQYFGRLKDDLQCEQEDLTWNQGDSLSLLQQLRSRNQQWQLALADEKIFKIAINNQIIHGHHDIKDGDAIAFLPPVTGG